MPPLPARAAARLLVCAAMASCSPPPATDIYATDYGLGPDKWATAWLLTHKAKPGAQLDVTPSGVAPTQGIVFDLPNAPVRRMTSQASFEVALQTMSSTDPVLGRMAQIIHQIEVDFWSADASVEADVVEHAYRQLQRRYGRDQVTPECYVAFFDRVHSMLGDLDRRDVPFDSDRLNLNCDELVQVANRERELVPEVPVADVLSAMAAGRRVVFVDVREASEFAEGHIPGAFNIPLREAGPRWAERFQGADYVVSYCVKDFRGFEMAKALAAAGVSNSVIMKPYGIKGWSTLGLPITGTRGLSEDEARKDMERCFAERGECLTKRAGASS
jgi:rhodanese-related sulfurtransferase